MGSCSCITIKLMQQVYKDACRALNAYCKKTRNRIGKTKKNSPLVCGWNHSTASPNLGQASEIVITDQDRIAGAVTPNLQKALLYLYDLLPFDTLSCVIATTRGSSPTPKGRGGRPLRTTRISAAIHSA